LVARAVLWIDLDEPDEADVEQLVDVLELSEESRASLLDPSERPGLSDHDDYLQVTACAPTGDRERKLAGVTCLVSRHWVVTAHAQPLDVLETFRERASASGDIGRLEGPEFLARLLEQVLESYFDAFEDIQLVLEDIDASSMAGDHGAKDGVLSKLVAVRRDIGGLRRSLTAHREVILSLTRPELEAITSSSAADRFATLRTRLEDAVQAARDSRDSVVGSFEILIANTGQRTNEIMKVLTLASVLILPGTLLAGIMGMNFKLGLFATEKYFWVTLAAMSGVALLTLVGARMRHWI
jgi:magnesium transporter